MKISFALRAGICIAALTVAPGRAEAQGPSAIRFESFHPPEFECVLPNCTGLAERRRSRLGRSVLVGALIGGSVGLLIAGLAAGVCGMDDSADARPCGEAMALSFGITVGTGALIGLLVGASEPSRGPVSTD